MNVLIDICHPAHVHLFKNLYFTLVNNNHNLTVTVRDIPSATELLRNLKIPYTVIGEKYNSWLKKAFQQFNYLFELKKVAKKSKIEIAIGTSLNITHLSLISKVTSIVLDDDDDDVEPIFVRFGHPFADFLFTPDSIFMNRKRKKNTIFHPATHECAYLHPRRYQPDPGILDELELFEKRFFILRFNAFKAHHDVGHGGITLEQQHKLVKLLEPYGRVLITTEGSINESLKKYQLRISADRIHDLLHYADMFIGDSQTMTTEAAILGTPSFKCNSFAGILSVPNEIEHKYRLCRSFKVTDFDLMYSEIEKQVNTGSVKEEQKIRVEKFFQDKIDLTGFLLWFCEKVHSGEWGKSTNIPWESFK